MESHGLFISKISEVVMALKVGIIKSSDVSKWCEYKGLMAKYRQSSKSVVSLISLFR